MKHIIIGSGVAGVATRRKISKPWYQYYKEPQMKNWRNVKRN